MQDLIKRLSTFTQRKAIAPVRLMQPEVEEGKDRPLPTPVKEIKKKEKKERVEGEEEDEDEEVEEEQEPEAFDIEDSDELMRTVGGRNMAVPKFCWRRSRWGRYCPVALRNGHWTPGKAEFSVG